MPQPHDPEVRAEARRLRIQGLNPRQISKRLGGIPAPTIDNWTKGVYQRMQRQRQEEVRAKARLGNLAADIASDMGIEVHTVRRWAGRELAAYRNSELGRVKSLALKGRTVQQIHQETGAPVKTIRSWAQRELKIAAQQGQGRRRGRSS